MKNLLISLLLFSAWSVFAQTESVVSNQKLTHHMSSEELARKDEIGKNRVITNPPVAPIINISEFQPSQGVVVRYPFGIPVSLVAQMSQLVTVTTIVASTSEQNTVTNQYQSAGVNMDHVDFLIAPTDSYWTRDFGPWFIIDGNGEFGIVDFVYNRPRPNDDAFAPVMANHLGINVFGMNMQHTGGNYMTDGYGTSASTTLTLSENGSTAAELQQMASDYLGINTYHFIDDPLDDYIEHIDCWGKFLAVDKVLIGQVPENDYRYQDYEDVANFFANTPTPWGYNYRVYRVYTPGSWNNIVPYTNSLILNDHVFVPQTGNQWDDEAIASYQEAMPGYTIVPVQENYSTPWENTDALHCRTHEVADLGMLLIRHYPLYGEQLADATFIINAEITAYSGQPLVSDSVLVYYRIDGGDWQAEPMVQQCGSAWIGTLTDIPEGSDVDYYIFAKDQSGRRERHPYIGAYDPHSFTVKESDCPTPTDLVATAEETTIVLTWAASEGVDSYSIYRNDILLATTSETTWTDQAVQLDTDYCYRLTAACPSGNSNYSDTACSIIVDITCDVPNALSGTVLENNTQLRLSWNRVENAITYTLYKNADELANEITDTTYLDDFQNDGSCYSVMSVCAYGFSEMSEEYCSPILPSVNELNAGFKVYPNPAFDVLNIESQENIHQLVIYNMVGQVVFSAYELNNSATISVTNFPKGMYLIQMMNNQTTYSQKLIIL